VNDYQAELIKQNQKVVRAGEVAEKAVCEHGLD